MRFEVQYPEGNPHEVELQGSVVTLGRDPSCDLVLHDVKCSRRHAVVEAGRDGLTIRDSGSANGIFVNGQKVERASLKQGDLVRLGDVLVKVLPDEVSGTLVMGPAESGDPEATIKGVLAQALRPATPPPPPAAATPAVKAAASENTVAPAAVPHPLEPRPLTVVALSALWLLAGLLEVLGALALAFAASGPVRLAGAAGALLMALVSGLVALGLWMLRPWARALQIAAAALGLLFCPFTLASIVTLVYMLRGATAQEFAAGPAPSSGLGRGPQEMAFTAALLGTVLLGALLSALAVVVPVLLRAGSGVR